PGSDSEAPNSWLTNDRYGALKMGVPVSCAAAEPADNPASPTTKSPPKRLRRMRFSLNVFGDHAYLVFHHLQKPATYGEATDGSRTAHRQSTLAQQRHERRVVRQNADLTVEGRRHHRVRLPVEHRGLRRDHRDLHHDLASCSARLITSSIPPCI